MDGVRVDTWVEPGAEVSPHYDSLLGKLMVWAPTRALAVERIQKAIDATRLRGAPNNVEFLRALVRDPRFVAGERMEGEMERGRGRAGRKGREGEEGGRERKATRQHTTDSTPTRSTPT